MRLGFACPYYGDTPPKVVVSQLTAVMHVAWQHPWVATITTDRSPHIVACEQILKRALSHKELDALFWTEHDCMLPIDAVTRLVKLLEARPDADVVTGITFMRYHPYHPMIATFAGELTQEMYESMGKRMISITRPDHDESPVGKNHYRFVTHIDTEAEPYEVTATSMNCLLFRRRTLELMATIPRPFDTDRCTTPDFALFDRLRGRVKLLVDPALLTMHLRGEREPIGFSHWVGAMEEMIDKGEAERLPDDSPMVWADPAKAPPAPVIVTDTPVAKP